MRATAVLTIRRIVLALLRHHSVPTFSLSHVQPLPPRVSRKAVNSSGTTQIIGIEIAALP